MQKLADRQHKILDTIIKEYIRTAEPVGSKYVQEQLDFEVSPATVRNEMAGLESAGLLISPHTSAGRLPTELGYRYFVNNLLRDKNILSAEEEKALNHIWNEKIDSETQLKLTAKLIAELSEEGVFAAFGPNSLYYTGLSNLFSQPEFSSVAVRISVAAVIDHLDEKINQLFKSINDGVEIMVGSENPLGSDCSVIVTRYKLPHGGSGIFGVLGPTRMDYEKNFNRVSYVHEIICKHD